MKYVLGSHGEIQIRNIHFLSSHPVIDSLLNRKCRRTYEKGKRNYL